MKRLATLEPINRLAAVVTGSGAHFNPNHKPSDYDVRDVQPGIRKWAETTGSDLTGIKFGRFTVIGYSSEKKSTWVVRCQCGLYEFRKSKSIKNPVNCHDRCLDCRQTFFITHGYQCNDTRTKDQRVRGEKNLN